MNKLMLIDGHSIVNRAFYGVPELSNASGLHVNAIYGFLNILFKLLDDESPKYLCVAFDMSDPTFRHEKYPEYKGTRKPMPEELREQIPVLKDVLRAMDITIVEHAGWEADDILGSLAVKAEREGMEVSLVSGDRDLLQIATDMIKIVLPKTKAGKTEYEIYHTQDVIDKYQVTPAGIIELKALMGDTSDNIPGVPKVGEKTATALLVEYGTVANVYDNLDKITKKGLHDTLEANRDKAELSRWLATIKTDCDTNVTWDEIELKNIYTDKAYESLKTLGLKKILDRFEGKTGTTENAAASLDIVTISDQSECHKLFESLKGNVAFVIHKSDKNKNTREESDGQMGFDLEAMTGTEEEVAGSSKDEFSAVSITCGDKTYVISPSDKLKSSYIFECIKSMIIRQDVNPVTYDVKAAYDYLCDKDDVISLDDNGHSTPRIDDMMLISYLLNPIKAKEYDTKPGIMTHELYADYEASVKALKDAGMYKLYEDIELPLAYVLYTCEKAGIIADRDKLIEYGKSLEGRISELEESICDKAGERFNINSPKQLGEILFGKMGIKGGKKTKSGYSTAADVLEKLAPEYPIVSEILEYRGLTKLKSTYADGLQECIAADGRIHTTFNQTITATGRISSTDPNLQNIPIRTELGRKIRKCFVPKEGFVFIDADYSQIELRLLAHMSQDAGLIEAYGTDADIHRITASKVFHIPFEEVTAEQRRDAKAVNFGLVYGISSFGLSQDLGISRDEAKKYIEEYFVTYPGVKRFLDDLVTQAKDKGYATTMYGRRRPIPELNNSNYMMRQFGERVAMNSPIQGSAADIMKLAMIRVYEALIREKINGRILIQVHDELLLEVSEEEAAKAADILKREMENAVTLAVKLEADVHEGNNWYEAK
ncbi:MAG: DNA polymerase I [Lachnospiraceae bacterium]|nr:DNA polymerase I [Lachnospiraceae bacterium]